MGYADALGNADELGRNDEELFNEEVEVIVADNVEVWLDDVDEEDVGRAARSPPSEDEEASAAD